MTTIRHASLTDLPEMLAIHNDVIATTTAIYEERPATTEEWRRWFEERTARDLPIFVAEDEAGGVAGFSSFGPWRTRWGYRHTVEHSVHVRADLRGRGLGRSLIEALFAPAAERNVHVMIGMIDSEAEISIRLHRSLGFMETGRFSEIAMIGGRWRDLVAMQRMIGDG